MVSRGHLGGSDGSLRHSDEVTGVRRETSAYPKTAGVVVCLPGWGRRAPEPAVQWTPDSGAR